MNESQFLEEFPNIFAPKIEIPHCELINADDSSVYRKKCMVCSEGVLLVARNKNGILEEYDRCPSCGQTYQYLDIKLLRKKDFCGEKGFPFDLSNL